VCTAAVAAFIDAVRERHRLNYAQTGVDPAPRWELSRVQPPSPVGPLPASLVASGQAVALCVQPLPNAVAAENETGKPSRVHTRGFVQPPLLPSSLLFLRLLKRHPCS
jgi:hypothetical protein